MTHPNVEYFKARAEICRRSNDAAKEEMQKAMIKLWSMDMDADVLINAHARLEATTAFVETLVKRIEDYEEELALLK